MLCTLEHSTQGSRIIRWVRQDKGPIAESGLKDRSERSCVHTFMFSGFGRHCIAIARICMSRSVKPSAGMLKVVRR